MSRNCLASPASLSRRAMDVIRRQTPTEPQPPPGSSRQARPWRPTTLMWGSDDCFFPAPSLPWPVFLVQNLDAPVHHTSPPSPLTAHRTSATSFTTFFSSITNITWACVYMASSPLPGFHNGSRRHQHTKPIGPRFKTCIGTLPSSPTVLGSRSMWPRRCCQTSIGDSIPGEVWIAKWQ